MPAAPDPLSFLSASHRRRIDRLCRLVVLLRRKACTRFELARRFRVTPKTIQRDLLLLKRRRFRVRGRAVGPHEQKLWWVER